MPISPVTLALRHAARIAAQGFRVTVHPDGAVTVEPVDAKPPQGAGSGGEEAAWDRLIAGKAAR
jgi:hypothetical protein